MTNDENPRAGRPPHLALRIVLLLFAFTEFINAVFDLPRLQEPALPSTPAQHFVDAVAATRIVLAPLITAAAFVFTIAGTLPRAVVAFAALIFVKAAASLALFATGLFGVPSGLDGMYWVLLRYVYPLMAICSPRASQARRPAQRRGRAGADADRHRLALLDHAVCRDRHRSRLSGGVADGGRLERSRQPAQAEMPTTTRQATQATATPFQRTAPSA